MVYLQLNLELIQLLCFKLKWSVDVTYKATLNNVVVIKKVERLKNEDVKDIKCDFIRLVNGQKPLSDGMAM